MMYLRRIGLTYYARFTIPKDRKADCGQPEVTRTLKTRDRREALTLRWAAIARIREELNGKLVAKGLRPLDEGWTPSLQDAADRAGQALRRASSEPYKDPDMARMVGSPRDMVRGNIFDAAEEIGDEEAATAFLDRALLETLPIRALADRWFQDIAGTIKNQTAAQHETALDRLSVFIACEEGARDANATLTGRGMGQIDRRLASRFVEWLQQPHPEGTGKGTSPGPMRKALNPKTVSTRVSSLSSFWKWAIRKGEAETNPWAEQTHGLKQKAAALVTEENDERPYTDAELVTLLNADPHKGHTKEWSWAAALFDTLRLGLLTGARQNEMASLTRRDIIGDCEGIRIRRTTTKTDSGAREVPLHAIGQQIMRARIAGLPPSTDPAAPLFPECPPGGPDGKRGWRLSVKFTEFRTAVLGRDETVDFHSLRRNFSTYMDIALAEGVSEATSNILDDLLGHKRGTLAGRTYIKKDLDRDLKVRAINGMVAKGMPPAVLEALKATAGNRPPLPRSITHPRPPDPGRRRSGRRPTI